jgi:uncharacterized protein
MIRAPRRTVPGLKICPIRADNTYLVAKFLLLLAIGIVVYLIVSRMRRDGEHPRGPSPPQSSGPAKPAAGGAEDMVRCAVCGVHLPRSESFTSRGRFYCSDEHRQLGAQRKD